MVETFDRELALLVDVSSAPNSTRACQMVDEFIEKLDAPEPGMLVDLNSGDLLLTRGVLTKMKAQLTAAGLRFGTVFTRVPQTQQAALDEGFYVKEKLSVDWTPIRMPLPAAAKKEISPEIAPKPAAPAPIKNEYNGVSLPDFTKSAKPYADRQPLPPPVAPSMPLDEIPVAEIIEVAPEEQNQDEPSVAEATDATTPETSAEHVIASFAETAFETLYIRQNLRSGQTVRFNGNVIIVGDVHAGSEITAGGDILVWGELRGIAHAGAQGNYKSEIRAMKIEALQLRIADYIARRPDRIYYHKENDHPPTVTPELAKVADGEIRIYKTVVPRS